MNIECNQAVLTELTDSFRFNDAVLRNLVVSMDEAVTEQSLIMKHKDDKGDRRRRDEDSSETVEADGDDAETNEAVA
jgi:small subunit ribosomal protein S6